MAETMMRLSPAQLQQITERASARAVRDARQYLAEEIAGRAAVERALGDDRNLYAADVLDELAESVGMMMLMAVDRPRDAERVATVREAWSADAERQPSRRDVPDINTRTIPAMREEEVSIGPPQRVKLTQEQVNREAAKLLVPGLEREPFPGWDATADDGLPPHVERSDEDDVHRLVR